MQPKLYKSMFSAPNVLHLSQLHDYHRTGWVRGKEDATEKDATAGDNR